MANDHQADAALLAVMLQATARALTVQAQVLEAHADQIVDRLAARQAEPEAPAESWSSGVRGCPHPEDERLSAATLRARTRFFCKACEEFITPGDPEPTAAPTLAPTT